MIYRSLLFEERSWEVEQKDNTQKRVYQLPLNFD